MNLYIVLLVLLQSLGCFCVPGLNVAPMAEKALEASMVEFNTRHAVAHLHRATKASVKRVIPVGLETYDLLMKFETKQTQCPKNSGEDAKTCALALSLFTPKSECSSRVRVTGTRTQVVTMNCARDQSSSSSSESSEEVFSRGRQQYVIPGLSQV
ncbi:secreted phosphoprotein 24 isoform X2 [Gadus chalcogrammus]|uniref:secreted phosphoprotein 24 isoform X2 n=1 Tax=Gadus chalcogrammus TaxID=1042646 RepID=UPI0024C33662|nr:secreted phosphoprotein 24 isoform X2 [Gadus chalcogrammus]